MLVLIKLMLFWQAHVNLAGSTDKEAAKLALEYVSRIEQNPCSGGTEETLELNVNHTEWETYVQPAILTANFITSVILENNGSLDYFTDEMFFSLVRNIVNSHATLFGACIAIEPEIYSKYSLFAPYAYRKNGILFAHDIALSYTYQDNKTVWYFDLKNRVWENATRTVSTTKYRSGNTSLPGKEMVFLSAKLEDGHWTKPYFDCGGGNIWMVTYASPIFSLDLIGRPKFQGKASVDIELTNIDINQCDLDTRHSYSDFDVFRGTHRCPSTTECKFLKGQGFKRGAYECFCTKGYYFPDVNAQVKAFSGLEMENSSDTNQYKCLPCKQGCSKCVDDSPCLYQFQFLFRFLLLQANLLTFIGIGVLFAVTVYFRDESIMKAGSPIFLMLMCLGGLMICSTGLFAYPQPSEFLCITQHWVFHTGFCLMYGALVAKTWRIAIIFRSADKFKIVYLPDKELLKRFSPLIFILALCLLIWTTSEKRKTQTLKTSNHLKYEVCMISYWLYAINFVEAFLLMIGVYMCYIGRKAPGHFNESKYMTWAVYNGILLGSFLLILIHLIGNSYGPDILYLFQCLQIQVFVTITLTLIFIPKLLSLYRKDDLKIINDSFNLAYGCKHMRTNSKDITQTKAVATQTHENVGAYSKGVNPHLQLQTYEIGAYPRHSVGTQTMEINSWSKR